MDGFDEATWRALGLVLTIVGLALSMIVWSRRGPASGLRGIAWSLLPLAAGLTGVLRLAWDITDSVVTWATRLVFSPVVWLGIAVAGLSLVLFVVSGLLKRRSGSAPRRGAAAGSASAAGAEGRAGGAALPRRRSTPAATPPAGAPAKGQPPRSAPADDMSEIEDILRRRGIS